MEFKYNTYYRCKTDKDVEDLWNCFKEQGGVREHEYTDTLDYMKCINKNNDIVFILQKGGCCWDSRKYFDSLSNIIITLDNYSNSDSDEKDCKDIINYSPIIVNINDSIPKVNVNIDELLNGQVFISKPKDYDDVRYNFMKCNNNGKSCILDLDTFNIYEDIDMYEVVKLLNCELNNVD